eukprot:COSAG04_NODE_14977_length_548_cov_0.614699_1_plen_86_part_00
MAGAGLVLASKAAGFVTTAVACVANQDTSRTSVTLGALNVPAHCLADHADHSGVASSRLYTVDTVVDHAANSTLIASSFLGERSL